MEQGIRDRLAVQLYTVRDQIARDPERVLARLAAMGWPAVEVSGFDYEPDELAAILAAVGLKTAGVHVDFARFVNDPRGVIGEARALGTRDVICPWLDEPWRSPEGYREVREILRRRAAEWAGKGIRVSYHNHDFEFQTRIDGVDGLSYLLVPPDSGPSVYAEFDVYWLSKGGVDPVAFMRPHRGRIAIFHLKDMSADGRETFAEVGTGLIDFDAILRFGRESGVRWYAVEQDECPGDPFDSLAISWMNLERLTR